MTTGSMPWEHSMRPRSRGGQRPQTRAGQRPGLEVASNNSKFCYQPQQESWTGRTVPSMTYEGSLPQGQTRSCTAVPYITPEGSPQVSGQRGRPERRGRWCAGRRAVGALSVCAGCALGVGVGGGQGFLVGGSHGVGAWSAAAVVLVSGPLGYTEPILPMAWFAFSFPLAAHVWAAEACWCRTSLRCRSSR